MLAMVFALSLLQAPPQAGQLLYRNDTYEFEVVVPPGWIQVPDSVLHERVLALRRMGAAESTTNYPAAFARAPVRDWFAHPYVLVQINELAADRPASLARTAANLNASGNTARYDPGQHAVLVVARIQLAPGSWVRSYSGIRMARRGLVSVMAYALEADSLSTAAIRDRFLAGLRVDSPPAAPQPAEYRNDDFGFRVAVPAGWVQVPDSQLRARVAFMRSNGATPEMTNYVAAFALATAPSWFAYPDVLVQVGEVPPEEMAAGESLLDSLAAMLNAMPIPETGNRLLTRPPDAFSARYDPGRRAVLLSSTRAQVQNGPWLRSYAAIRLTRRGLVWVLAYGFEADSVATAAIRDLFLAALEIR